MKTSVGSPATMTGTRRLDHGGLKGGHRGVSGIEGSMHGRP